jgi:predicted nucleic acid-binding protein
MRSVVIDANVLVGLADDADHRHASARAVAAEIRRIGASAVFLDVLVAESASVLCRRAQERRRGAPDEVLRRLSEIVGSRGGMTWASRHLSRLWESAWDVMRASSGRLNFNDAFVVCLLREGIAEGIATLDDDFEGVPGVQRLHLRAP